MRGRRIGSSAALALLMAATLTGVTVASHGFDTGKDPYLVPTAPGVVIDPILSTGDIVGDYQMSGIPDGLGAYSDQGDDGDRGRNGRHGRSFTVLMNHELGKTFPGQPVGVDTRISKVRIDSRTRKVLEAEYVFRGTEGFERFCSATLSVVDGTPYYFTGEEAINAGHDGSSIAMNARTGEWVETPHFGKLQHENVVPLKLSKWVFLTSEDDFRVGENSYLYAYIAPSFRKAIAGSQGGLHVWKADDPTETGTPTATKGESIPGRFVPISQAENTSSTALKAAATSRGAFQFDRLEDIAARPDVRGRTYIADTGKSAASNRGRVYQFDVDPSHPTKATLKMILNGNAPDNDDIINPDNMAASGKVLVIQEDRESAFRDPPFAGGYGRVMVYDFRTRTIRSVARVNTPPHLRPGTWESSGVIDAGEFLGRGWWLLDVQAHSTTVTQPGLDLQPNTGSGEDGQLLAIYIPNSQGDGDHR